MIVATMAACGDSSITTDVESGPGERVRILSAGSEQQLPQSGVTGQVDRIPRVRAAIVTDTTYHGMDGLAELRVDHARVGAATGQVEAEREWREYHGLLAAARALLADNQVRGPLTDAHGPDGTSGIELGNLLTATDRAAEDLALNRSSFLLRSSIRDPDRPIEAQRESRPE